MKTPSLSTENLQRKGPTHNTTVCTCTSFFTCFTCSFSCFAHIIALFALYRSLTLCLLCFCWEHMPTWASLLTYMQCSITLRLKRIYIHIRNPPRCLLVSFPDPAPLRGKEAFLGILCVSNHVTHAYAHAHFSNKRVIRELRIVSCPGGGVWVAVTREFERDNCVISEILQSDWTIPNRAGVPRKSTKVPRPSFVRESREGLGPRRFQVHVSSP